MHKHMLSDNSELNHTLLFPFFAPAKSTAARGSSTNSCSDFCIHVWQVQSAPLIPPATSTTKLLESFDFCASGDRQQPAVLLFILEFRKIIDGSEWHFFV